MKPSRHPRAANGAVSSSLRPSILIAIQLPEDTDAAVAHSLAELELMTRDLGYSCIARVIQKRSHRGAPTFIGEGKLEEIAAITGGPGTIARGPETQQAVVSGITVFVDDELTPGQMRNLELALGAEVWDRVAVILKIFEARAQTRESKLEVELARLEYELPRIRDDHSLGDREGGGGRASRGHSNVELAKQRKRERIATIRRELEQLRHEADKRLQVRGDVFRVALVGYTNAGKSSLMRRLTGSDVLVEDKLFATLGTTTRQLAPPATPPVLVTDTVGFINRLPHALIASFHATLAEAREAWLVLHVIDAADPHAATQYAVTNAVLKELGLEETAMWTVLNKVDQISPAEQERLKEQFPEAMLVSALNPDDGRMLRERLIDFFGQTLVRERLKIPYGKQSVLGEFRSQIQMEQEEYGEVLEVTVRATPAVMAQLKARLARPLRG
ncbi:GTPase HflX [Oligoflexus tunisiensis]|uniref:GTPase HflX n=1 Tax=Oligoflexus tunisiensis TaxID=708132 RepID=UPI000ABF7EC4|nr:GTPase HflX [Oligoflexus tunisiensis]